MTQATTTADPLTAAEILAFIAPEVANLPASDVDTALLMAEAYRPWCLSDAKKNEAQALYAAWLLSTRNTGGVSGGASESTTGPVVERKEGDLQVKYATASDVEGLTAYSTGDYWARYEALAKQCGVGAILVGHPGGRCGCGC